MSEERAARPLGVYIHIPFCRTKCPYCAFESGPLPQGFDEEELVGLYGKDLTLKTQNKGLSGRSVVLCSIYIGGGTPSVLSPRAVRRLIDLVRGGLGTGSEGGGKQRSACVEITLEANPADVDEERLLGYRSAGVNRLSLGVQSLEERDLRVLGRRHTAGSAISAMTAARKAGFENLSVDLIFGLPGQTLRAWLSTLRGVIDFRPEHLSLYDLSIEEGTPFYTTYHALGRGGGSEAKPLLSEETEAEMYEAAIDTLVQSGYVHYELSNFALLGRKSVHNEGYWLGREYLGLGPGAHSFVLKGGWGQRYWNYGRWETYRERLLSGLSPVEGCEDLTQDEALVEAVFLGLRMPGQGLDLARLGRNFGKETMALLRTRCERYASLGLMEVNGNEAVLSRRAFFVSNEVMAGLLG